MSSPWHHFRYLNMRSCLPQFSSSQIYPELETIPSRSLTFLVLLWTRSTLLMFFLKYGAQNWTQYSRCGLNNAVQRGTVMFIDLDCSCKKKKVDAVLGCIILLAHVQLMIHSHPVCMCRKVLFHICCLFPTQSSNLAFVAVEIHLPGFCQCFSLSRFSWPWCCLLKSLPSPNVPVICTFASRIFLNPHPSHF